jgi:site-specific DNA recombinase
MTDAQLATIADAFGSLLDLLRHADPRGKAELYSRIGLRMTYQPGAETMIAEVVTPAINRVFDGCPRGDTNQNPTRATTVRRHPAVLTGR